jgi:hypothetical protein
MGSDHIFYSGTFITARAMLEKRVTVGMPVTRHPPYRSVREVLPHTAPTSGNNAGISDLEKDVQL